MTILKIHFWKMLLKVDMPHSYSLLKKKKKKKKKTNKHRKKEKSIKKKIL